MPLHLLIGNWKKLNSSNLNFFLKYVGVCARIRIRNKIWNLQPCNLIPHKLYFPCASYSLNLMTHITLSSVKGPVVDSSADQNSVEFYENKKERGLNFPKGVDPQVLINAIYEIKDVYKSL